MNEDTKQCIYWLEKALLGFINTFCAPQQRTYASMIKLLNAANWHEKYNTLDMLFDEFFTTCRSKPSTPPQCFVFYALASSYSAEVKDIATTALLFKYKKIPLSQKCKLVKIKKYNTDRRNNRESADKNNKQQNQKSHSIPRRI